MWSRRYISKFDANFLPLLSLDFWFTWDDESLRLLQVMFHLFIEIRNSFLDIKYLRFFQVYNYSQLFRKNVYHTAVSLCASIFGVAVSLNRFTTVCNLKAVQTNISNPKIHILISGTYTKIYQYWIINIRCRVFEMIQTGLF